MCIRDRVFLLGRRSRLSVYRATSHMAWVFTLAFYGFTDPPLKIADNRCSTLRSSFRRRRYSAAARLNQSILRSCRRIAFLSFFIILVTSFLRLIHSRPLSRNMGTPNPVSYTHLTLPTKRIV